MQYPMLKQVPLTIWCNNNNYALIYLGWSSWSEWTPSGTCKDDYRLYIRSRMCSNPSLIDYCIEGEWDEQYMNNTASSCSQNTGQTAIILGAVTAITLIVMLAGMILGIMCLRLWIRRTAYNLRSVNARVGTMISASCLHYHIVRHRIILLLLYYIVEKQEIEVKG